jgi:leucyl aminopeptidase
MLAWSAGAMKSEPEPLQSVRIESTDEAQMKGLAEGLGIAEAVNYARTLAWTPPSIATPQWMSDQARRLASEQGLDFRVYAGEELVRERLTGIATVGGASANAPCLIRLEYNPHGSDEAPIVLVGKTITYDTGGLSIKGKTSMPGMKGDKGGGCAVLGAMKAIAETLKPGRRVVALLTAAENSISGSAYRPDDVMTYRNGSTVEVTNTDAEGRLVLADGLIWASEVEGAAGVADIATLTGGVVTALGKVMAGIFSNSDALAEAAYQAGQKTGDRVWRLPLDPEYKELMKSPIADILNSNLNGQAHPVQGATFLAHFVPDDLPWVHVDMAGMMEKASGGPWVQGPTGFGVRLLSELVMTWPATTE